MSGGGLAAPLLEAAESELGEGWRADGAAAEALARAWLAGAPYGEETLTSRALTVLRDEVLPAVAARAAWPEEGWQPATRSAPNGDPGEPRPVPAEASPIVVDVTEPALAGQRARRPGQRAAAIAAAGCAVSSGVVAAVLWSGRPHPGVHVERPSSVPGAASVLTPPAWSPSAAATGTPSGGPHSTATRRRRDVRQSPRSHPRRTVGPSPAPPLASPSASRAAQRVTASRPSSPSLPPSATRSSSAVHTPGPHPSSTPAAVTPRAECFDRAQSAVIWVDSYGQFGTNTIPSGRASYTWTVTRPDGEHTLSLTRAEIAALPHC